MNAPKAIRDLRQASENKSKRLFWLFVFLLLIERPRTKRARLTKRKRIDLSLFPLCLASSVQRSYLVRALIVLLPLEKGQEKL